MKMKTLVASAVLVLALAMSATGFAQISKSDLNIGGFYYGQPWSEVINRLGQPVKVERRPPVGHHYTFQNGERFFFRLNNSDRVIAMNGDMASKGGTKAGIKIGSSFDDVISVYGEPDYVSHNGRMLGYEAEKKFGPMLCIYFDKVYGTVNGMNFGTEFREGDGEKLPNRNPHKNLRSPKAQSLMPLQKFQRLS